MTETLRCRRCGIELGPEVGFGPDLCGYCECDIRNEKRRASEKTKPGSQQPDGWAALVRILKSLVCWWRGHRIRWSVDDCDDQCRYCGAFIYCPKCGERLASKTQPNGLHERPGATIQSDNMPDDPPVRSTECSATAYERQYLGRWESTAWQKPGAACYYTHRTTKQELPARILEIEYEHGRGRARCEIMDVTGRLRVRWMETCELHQSPNGEMSRPAADQKGHDET